MNRAIAFLITFFFPAMLLAADATSKPTTTATGEQAWWQVLLSTLLHVVFVIGVPVLVTVIYSLLKRWNIGIEREQIEKIAEQAANWAEHKAKAALKDGGKKTPGAEKMALALKFAKDLAEQYKLTDKASAKLKELIEASLEKKEVAEKKEKKPPALEA